MLLLLKSLRVLKVDEFTQVRASPKLDLILYNYIESTSAAGLEYVFDFVAILLINFDALLSIQDFFLNRVVDCEIFCTSTELKALNRPGNRK